MNRFRLALVTLTLSVGALTTAGGVRSSVPQISVFSATSLAALKAQKRPILVDVAAWWCPVCASQSRTIKRLLASPKYKNLVILHLDYDKQRADWQSLGATRQATLIAYHGKNEVGRIAFETDPAKIEALMSAAVN